MIPVLSMGSEGAATKARYLFVGKRNAILEISAMGQIGGQVASVPQELQECAEAGFPYHPAWAERITICYPERDYPMGERASFMGGKSAQLMFALQRLVAIAALRRGGAARTLEGVYAVGELQPVTMVPPASRDDPPPSRSYDLPAQRSSREHAKRNFGDIRVRRCDANEDTYHLREKLLLLFDALANPPAYGPLEDEALLLVPPDGIRWLAGPGVLVEREGGSSAKIRLAASEKLAVRVIEVHSLADALDLLLGKDVTLITEPRHANPWALVASLSLGSGELIWWPYFAAKYGFAYIAPLVVLAACLQWPLNYAIGCHALATRETLLVGVWRVSPKFGFFIYSLFTIAFLPFAAYGYLVGRAIASLGAGHVLAAVDLAAGTDLHHAAYRWGIVSIVVAALVSAWEWKRLRFRENKCVGILVTSIAILLVCLLFGASNTPERTRAPLTELFHPLGKDFMQLLGAVILMGLGGFWNMLYSVFLIQADGAGQLGGAAELRTRLRNDASIGLLFNLVLTLLLCGLAHRFLATRPGASMDVTAVLTEQARGFGEGWQAGAGRVLYLVVVVLVLWDTLPITAHAVSGMHASFLSAVGKQHPWAAKTATLLGADGWRAAVGLYATSLLLVLLAQRGEFLDELNLRHGHMMLVGMPFCCVAALLVGRRFWPTASGATSAVSPQKWVTPLLWFATITYGVLAAVVLVRLALKFSGFPNAT